MIVRNGQPFNVDNPWVDENGIQHPANWYRLATPEEREALGFGEIPDPPIYDPRYYYPDGSSIPLDVCKSRVKSELATIRWSKETSGVIYNNAVFATDPQSKINYLAAVMQAQANTSYSVVWKAKTVDEMNPETKFVTLTANDIVFLTNSGIDYITKCFVNEDNLLKEIDNAPDLTALLAIDLQSGWPTREY